MRRDILAKIKIDTKLFREPAIKITIARRTCTHTYNLGELLSHKRAHKYYTFAQCFISFKIKINPRRATV